MKTKDKVKYWLNKHPSLKDDDERLSANIWSKEIQKLGCENKDFLRLYATKQLTSAPSIKRARAKLQEEEPQYRGAKYLKRQGKLQDKWRNDLGYPNKH
tara:strand:+ start:714 stop:1010 length:297 start_codon:yes stop_codon:yes gene_type:complete